LKEAETIGRVGSFEWTAETDTTVWSDGMYRIHGMEIGEKITHEKLLSLIHPDDRALVLEKTEQCREQPCNVSITHRIVRPDGEVRIITRDIKSFAGETGAVSHIAGTVQDVTEQQFADQRIREQAHYLQRIYQTVPDLISVTELETMKSDYLNKDTFAVQGFDTDKLSSSSRAELQQMIHEDDREAVSDYFRSFKEASDDQVITAEYRSRDDHGHWQWFLVRGRVFQRNASGEVTHVLNIIENITVRKAAQQEVHRLKDSLTQKAEDKYRRLFESMDEGFAYCEVIQNQKDEVVGWKYLDVNPALEKLAAIKSTKLAGRVSSETFPGPDERWIKTISKVLATRKPALFEEYDDVTASWYEAKIFPFDDLKFGLIYRDITERKTTAENNWKSVEEDAKANRDMLLQMALASPDAITIYDLNSKQAVYLNDRLAQWTGHSNAELVQLGYEGRLKLIYAADRKKLAAFNNEMLSAEDGEIRTVEYRLITNHGVSWIRNRCKVFSRDANGTPTHLLSVLQDFSEEMNLREQLNERTRYAETVIDASIDRMYVFDKDFKVMAWNKRSEAVTGVTRENILGRKIFDVFPRLAEDSIIRQAMTQAVAGQYNYVPAKQALYVNSWYERFYVPLQNEKGETFGVLAIMHDVTDMVIKENELKELNKTMERKNAELEQKNEEITHFSFVASHDLQEPLRKIHTFANWIQEQEASQLSPMGKNFTAKIKAAVRRMELLIEDILVLTKIHSDKHRDEEVNLEEVLDNVKEDMGNEIRYSGTTIVSDPLPTVRANGNQVFYLLKNLVSNAIKFQRAGNAPHIKIKAEVMDGSTVAVPDPAKKFVCVSVTDNGFGFDKKYENKIFHVFQRLHGRNDFEGTGIGLAICKKIMENHDGLIRADSEKGKGSTFYCYFPLQ
jgi:PAS domain S-box-containing protein